MKKVLSLIGAACFIAVGCDNSDPIEPKGPGFFSIQPDHSFHFPPSGSGATLWMLASDNDGTWIDVANISEGDFELNAFIGEWRTFDLHLVYTHAGNNYKIDTWLDVPIDSQWRLVIAGLQGSQGGPMKDQTFDQASAVVPDFKGSIVNSRRSWKISGSNGDVSTIWGFQQAALNTEFRYPTGDSDVVYSDIIDNECVYQRATGFLPYDKITFSQLKPMDNVIVVDYPDNSYFYCGFYGWRNRDNLNTGLRGFILSERLSEIGQVPLTKMGYVDGFYSYKAVIHVRAGKRFMSYIKLGGKIPEAPAFTNIDFTYTGKTLSAFNATPNIGFHYFEATWSKPGMADWTVHGPGDGQPQSISFAFKPLPDEVIGEGVPVDHSLLKLRETRLTQYSREFVYSDRFPVYKDPIALQKTYEEVFEHTLVE